MPNAECGVVVFIRQSAIGNDEEVPLPPSPVKKAVIPAAGLGTRMHPDAKAVPKELLPILDRPTIQYVVEEAAAASITDVLLITSPDKRAIEDHFANNPALEGRLRAANKSHLLASINALLEKVTVR